MSRKGLTSFVYKRTFSFRCEGFFLNDNLERSVVGHAAREGDFEDVGFDLVWMIACFDNLETLCLRELRCLVVGVI